MNKMNKKGFTLIEMLVVIAIIAVLVSIIVPVVGNSTNKAAAATNAANLRSSAASIAIALLEDNNGITEGAVDMSNIKNFTAPKMKPVTDITGGDFTATVKDGNVVCTFGTDGTIDNYVNVAEDGKLDK